MAVLLTWKVHALSRCAQIKNVRKYHACQTKPISELNLACVLQFATPNSMGQKREPHEGEACFIPWVKESVSLVTPSKIVFLLPTRFLSCQHISCLKSSVRNAVFSVQETGKQIDANSPLARFTSTDWHDMYTHILARSADSVTRSLEEHETDLTTDTKSRTAWMLRPGHCSFVPADQSGSTHCKTTLFKPSCPFLASVFLKLKSKEKKYLTKKKNF